MRPRTQTSIGTVETWGHTAAVTALDAGMKAANVVFGGYRITPSALVTVAFRGDVAAVRTAVAAAVAAAGKVGRIVSHHVIPRPHDQLRRLLEHPPPATGPSGAPHPPVPEGGAKTLPPAPEGGASPAGKPGPAAKNAATDRPKAAPAARGKAALLQKTTPPPDTVPRTVSKARKRVTPRKRGGTA